MASEMEQADRPEQVVGGLLRSAGRRVPPPEECARRVRAAVHAQWRRGVRARRLRRAALWTSLATVAAGAAWLALVLPESPGGPAPGASPSAVDPPSLAKVERLEGQVRLVGAAAAQEPRPLAAGEEIPKGALLESGSGRVALRLHGGSSLRIDARTRLRLVSPEQVMLEQGAVYVDSEPSRASAAVTVRTPLGIVRERGTQFEVRVGKEALQVRVREGRVDLEHAAAAEEGTAGVELRLQDGRVSRRRIAIHAPEWGWVQQIAPAFELEGESLGRFLAWVSRETGRPVRLADGGGSLSESDASTRLHGSIAGLSPEQALSAVLPACGRTHWFSGAAIVVGRVPGASAGGGVR